MLKNITLSKTSFFFSHNINVFIVYTFVSFLILNKVIYSPAGLINSLDILFANLFLMIAAYSLNRVSDQEEDKVNKLFSRITSSYDIYFLCAVLTILSFLLYIKTLNLPVIIGGLVLILLSYMYSFSKEYRLKKIFLVKNIVPSFSWYLSIVLMVYAGIPDAEFLFVAKLLFPIFIFFFLFEVLWDLPDKNGDEIAGIKTLPTLIGFNATRIFLAVTFSLLFVFINSIQNKIALLALLIFTVLINEKTPKIQYHYFLVFLIFLLIAVNI